MFGTLKKVKTPLPVDCPCLEEDKSPLLKLKEHRQFQCLLGILQWLHTIARPELGPLMANLNRFGTCPSRDCKTQFRLPETNEWQENINRFKSYRNCS